MPKVTMSNLVAASPDMIWQSIGSFGAIADWHPMIERSPVKKGDKGEVRELSMVGGGKIVERLETIDEKERRYTYAIVDSPLPVSGYVSELRVIDNGNGTSTVEWSSSFEPTTSDSSGVTRQFEDLYKAGLDNIQRMFTMGRSGS